MTRPLYDWPVAVTPSAAIVIAPSFVTDGFLSRAGYENNVGIAGARNQMRMEFPYLRSEGAHMFPWLINNARKALFLVPVFRSPQLPTRQAMETVEATYPDGIPFSTDEPFSSGFGFFLRF